MVPGRAVEAEQLWYDRHRWQSWIDGFGKVVSLDDEWPLTGARLMWDAPPAASRGRVVERVTRYEPRLGQTLDWEDALFMGVRRVTFEPGMEETRITLEVRETNLPAQLFFKSAGFRAVTVLRAYYEDSPEDAYLMQYRHAHEEVETLPVNRIDRKAG